MIAEPWVSLENVTKPFEIKLKFVCPRIEVSGLAAQKFGCLWKFEVNEWVCACCANTARERENRDDSR